GRRSCQDPCTFDRLRTVASGLFVAHFGYMNTASVAVALRAGPNVTVARSNKFFPPQPDDRGQPTVFEPGLYFGVFKTPFDGRPLEWIIGGFPVVADAGSLDCSEVEGITLTLPPAEVAPVPEEEVPVQLPAPAPAQLPSTSSPRRKR